MKICKMYGTEEHKQRNGYEIWASKATEHVQIQNYQIMDISEDLKLMSFTSAF